MREYQASQAEKTENFNTEFTTQSGVVRKLKDGYGFIAGNDGSDYFFHWSAMQKETKDFRELEVGDRVSFIPFSAPKGMRAIEVFVEYSGES